MNIVDIFISLTKITKFYDLFAKRSIFCFDKQKLIHLTKFYDKDFLKVELFKLEDQLEYYIMDLRSNMEFSSLFGISDLARKMVEIKNDKNYRLIYLFVTLTLILSVVTSIVKFFFNFNIVKNDLKTK